MIRCTICANSQVTAIDAALGAGSSIRAAARFFQVSRSSLARHRQHVGVPVPAAAAERAQFEEATRQLDRAGTPRERLRGLEAVRSALRLELRDFARARSAMRSPDEEQLRALERNLEGAWLAYESVADGSVDVAHRALQGVREAVAALREATARQVSDPARLTVADHGGTPIASWDASASEVLHGIPREYQTSDFTIRVRAHFYGFPDVTVYDASGKLAWRKPGAPASDNRPRRALPHEEPPGNGHHGHA